MSEIDLLRLKLENVFPEDKSLSPIEMSELLNDFCVKRGLTCKFGYLRKKELDQELISRINKFYKEKFDDLTTIIGYKSGRSIRNKYYQMVFAILEHHHFGIANNKNKLIKLSFNRFAEIFDVDRKTTSNNQVVVNFYSKKRYKLNVDNKLKIIFSEIENKILE